MDFYEMRRGRDVLCTSTVPNLGYPLSWLRDMSRNGIYLYKNGKRVLTTKGGYDEKSLP